MKHKRSFTWFCLVLLFSVSIQYGSSQTSHKKPTVGLVLSGGGAKGLAHVGVLKVLEEAGMPVDYIGGTSMGSIVGGLYAAGYSADSLISIIKTLDWDYLLSDDISRREMSILEKPDNDRFLLSFPFEKNNIDLPEGVIRGQHIENKLTGFCTPVYEVQDFSNLPIPFLCIAADIENGKEAVLTGGNLPEAMRASMSIPSVFEPKIYQGRKMVDGGIVNNFPLRQVKDMGADIIIGVDVSYGSQGKRKSENIFSIMEDVVFLYSNQVKERNLDLADIIIQPDLHGLSISSFNSADSLIYYGETAARAMYPRLKFLADSINQLRGENRRKNNPIKQTDLHVHDSLYITSIGFEGLINASRKILHKYLSFSVLQWVKASDLGKAAENFYATNYFNKVTYRLYPESGGTRVVFNFSEKSPGLMRFGFYYDIDTKATLYSNLTFYHLLIKDTRFSLNLGLGRSPEISLLYYLNKGPVPAPGIEFGSNWIETFLYDENRFKTSSYTYNISRSSVFLQSDFGSKAFLKGGGILTHTIIIPKIFEGARTTSSYSFYGLFGEVMLDTRDHPVFPERGQKWLLRGTYLSNQYLKPFAQLFTRYNFTIPAGRKLTIQQGIYGGFSYGDSIPFQYNFYVGGMSESIRFNNSPFIGYNFMESGPGITRFLYGRLDMRYEMFKDIYLSAMGNIGYQNRYFTSLFEKSNLISGYGLSLGIKTPVGPLEGTIMSSGESFKILGYLKFGYWF